MENFDYSQNGMYFVTICTKNREHYFGEIVNGKMILNELGKITENVWKNLPHHYLNIKLDTYTIMPNHFHCIIEIVGTGFVRTGFKPVPTDIVKNHSLSEIIRGFKTFSARFINQQQKMQGRNIWQR
ncbi:MAG: transposase, partial [Candidatus Moraniibacteriota bacterium]